MRYLMSFFKNIVCVTLLFGVGYINQSFADSFIYEDRLALKYSIEIRKKMDVSFSELDASSKVNYHIDRFAGCHGTMNQAKKNLKPATQNLEEPLFRTNTFDKGILNLHASSKPVCIAFDSPNGVVNFQGYTMNLNQYVFSNIWDCMEGCGDDYCTDEQGN